jgi:hypothetical protein
MDLSCMFNLKCLKNKNDTKLRVIFFYGSFRTFTDP